MASYLRCIVYVGAIMLVACESDEIIKHACKRASNQQFCITSLSNAKGGPTANLSQLSVIAVGLTAVEAKSVSKRIAKLNHTNPNYHGIRNCVRIFNGLASEMKKLKSELKGLASGDSKTIICDVQRGLNDVGYDMNECYVKLKESGAAELIPIVVEYTDKLTLLTSDAQSVASFLE